MNRIDVCDAYWVYYMLWHASGLTRRCHAQGRGIAEQLHRLRYRASPLLGSEHDLTDDARDVYDGLVQRWEGVTA